MDDSFIFRAWDKRAKKMREVDSIAFHNSRSVCDYDSSRLPKVANVWGLELISQQDMVLHRDIKQIELMRCIGSKDKNNKLIFEDDIVKDRNGFILRVVYKCERATFALENEEYIGYMSELRYLPNTLEIIGNIYENPELWGVEND